MSRNYERNHYLKETSVGFVSIKRVEELIGATGGSVYNMIRERLISPYRDSRGRHPRFDENGVLRAFYLAHLHQLDGGRIPWVQYRGEARGVVNLESEDFPRDEWFEVIAKVEDEFKKTGQGLVPENMPGYELYKRHKK